MKFALQLVVASLFLEKQVVPAGPPPSMSSMPTNPVSKVVKLLQDMSVGLATEQKKDEEVFEKYSCWCETTIKEKTEALEKAALERSELESSIETETANKARLETELKELKEERTANEEAIATATELRGKEKATYEAETAEMRATVASITEALSALKKGTGIEVVEGGPDADDDAAAALLQVQHHLELQSKKLPAAVLLWLETKQSQPAGFKSYNAKSGAIVGILAQMKDDFKNDIAEATAAEEKSQASFAKLVAAKQAEIKAQTESVLEKTQQKTDAEVALVQAKHDLKDLTEQVAADEKVLADANERCPKMEAQFNERREQRSEEIDAIAEALTILTDDSARETFGSTFSFLQVSVTQSLRAKASLVLQRAALKAGATLRSAALMQLAQQTKLSGLDKVKKYIDDMIVSLGEEQKAEVEHQRWCDGELDKNKDEVREKTWKQEDLDKKVNDLAGQLEALDDDLKGLGDAIAENLRSIKRAGEDRVAANAEFEAAVKDQRGAVMLLTKVLERLQMVYAPDALKAKREKARVEAENAEAAERQKMTPGAANAGIKVANDQQVVPEVLVQQPGGFEEYKKQSSGGVLGLIEQTIGDAERLVTEATHAEQEQQEGYEQLVADTGASLAADRKAVSDKTGERATAAMAKDEAEKDLQATGKVLEDLGKYAASVHSACDFVLNNFDLRQEARAGEIDSLKEAHAILSGAGGF